MLRHADATMALCAYAAATLSMLLIFRHILYHEEIRIQSQWRHAAMARGSVITLLLRSAAIFWRCRLITFSPGATRYARLRAAPMRIVTLLIWHIICQRDTDCRYFRLSMPTMPSTYAAFER